MAPETIERTQVRPTEEEQALAARAAARLHEIAGRQGDPRESPSGEEGRAFEEAFRGGIGMVVHRPGGQDEEIPLPAVVARLTAEAAELIARGCEVAVSVIEDEVSTTEAARILNVSRPFATQLMDAGEIPCRRVGSHRRARRADVLRYKEQMDTRADASFQAMVELSESLGLYR
jgi:excisionase family DNA binding protein